MKKYSQILLILAFNVILPLVVLEICLELSLRFPGAIPDSGFRDWLIEYHMNHDRRSVSYIAECSRSSKGLGYEGRPNGSCRFKSREFDIDIRLNSKGTRDPEVSLEKAEILILGDSQAFGWGVEREESLSGQLEKMTGRKVLTVAYPSYGTVREILKLRQFDVSNIKWVIVQYHENDRDENFSFISKNFHLAVMPPSEYVRYARLDRRTSFYWPGKHLYYTFKAILARRIFGNDPQKPGKEFFTPKIEANTFTTTLYLSRVKSADANVWVVQLNAWGKNNDQFINALTSRIAKIKRNYPFFERVIPLSVVDVIDPKKHHYVLDDHLNAKGHTALAEFLLGELKKKSPDIVLGHESAARSPNPAQTDHVVSASQ